MAIFSAFMSSGWLGLPDQVSKQMTEEFEKEL
jgi:hypothetical protein